MSGRGPGDPEDPASPEPAQPARSRARQPGETAPRSEWAEPGDVAAVTGHRSRPLARPPGERYREGSPPDGPPGRPPPHDLRARDRSTRPGDTEATGPRLGRATLLGAAVAATLAVVWVVPATILDISAGLIVLAALWGWLIGSVVRMAAWRGRVRMSHGAVGLLGGALSIAAWLGGTFLDYVVSLALLPASSVDLAQRLANEPFLAWLEPQLVPLKLLEVLLAALVGWRSAR